MNTDHLAGRFCLSTLEFDIIRGLSCGLQTKELATSLHRSCPTIESYVRLLYARFNARTRAHLVARSFACGLLRVADSEPEVDASGATGRVALMMVRDRSFVENHSKNGSL